MLALKQWVKIAVHRSFSLNSLKSLLSTKFDCAFEHLPLRAFAITELPGNKLRRT